LPVLSVLQALVLSLGGLLSVGSPAVVFVLLSNDGHWRRAGAFALGYYTGYLLVGALGLLVGDQITGTADNLRIGSIVYLVLGISLIALAAFTARKLGSSKPSRLMRAIGRLGVLRMLAVGLVVPVLNLKNLTIFLALVTALAEVPLAEGLVVLPALVLLFCLTTWLPVLLRVALPDASGAVLDRSSAFLGRRGRALSVAALLLFGIVFLVRGLV